MYHPPHFSPSIISLYLNTILRQVGSGLVSLFGVIFFFEKFGSSIDKVIILFIIYYFLYAIFLPLVARLIGRLGIKKMMITAMPFLVATMLCLYLWDFSPYLFLVLYVMLGTIYRLLFWVPYHVDFAEFTEKGSRGRQMAFLLNISEVVLAITPLIGGFIIARHSYSSLFLIAAIVISIAVIPLFFVRPTYEEYTFKYLETFRRLFKKENRPILVANVSNGIQGAVGVIIWPIFIFAILKGQYISVGLVTALTIVALIILRTITGSLIDRWGEEKILKISTFFYATGWVLKVFVNTGFHVFLTDTYQNFGKVVNKTAFDATFYDQAADQEHYIDEYTVLRTVALNIGRIAMLAVALPIIALFGITATFIVAAVATLFMTAITKRIAHVEQ